MFKKQYCYCDIFLENCAIMPQHLWCYLAADYKIPVIMSIRGNKCHVWVQCMISKGNHVKFASFVHSFACGKLCNTSSKVNVIASEEKKMFFVYKVTKGQLLISFHFGEWNRYDLGYASEYVKEHIILFELWRKKWRHDWSSHHDLCHYGAVLYQLNYQVNWELVGFGVCTKAVVKFMPECCFFQA